jgi:hypothetical protein
MQIGLGRGLVRGQTEPSCYLTYHGLQKLGPSGVFERELVGVNFEGVPDGDVHDGFCPFTERGLNGGGLDKLSVALAEGEANQADPVYV